MENHYLDSGEWFRLDCRFGSAGVIVSVTPAAAVK